MSCDTKTSPILRRRSLLFAAFVFLFHGITAADNSTYKSPEILLINCGSDGSVVDQDGRRIWQGDEHSKFLSTNDVANSSVATATPQGSAVSYVAFKTARIFTGPVTYTIPVMPDRSFVRLYFYPTEYGGRNASDAVFGVTATYETASIQTFTLLSNFTPSSTVEALINVDFIVPEYSLNVSTSKSLNLTFTPSKGHTGSYAFVNGIEVISIPDIFPQKDGIPGIGFGPYDLNPAAAMETVYRLNVGGATVARVDDSGLFRQWDADENYIFGSARGLPRGMDSNITLRYPPETPRYIAPDPVYMTQRSMTGDVQINKESNLTWSLSVDPGFYYLMRLHFCDIQSIYNKPNERVFSIFINNATAEDQADVFAWATKIISNVQEGSALGVPFYRDYITFLPDAHEQGDLRLDLHPNDWTKPQYVDAVLNGLEVFKISSKGDNLAGIGPSPSTTNNQRGEKTGGGHRKSLAVVGIAVVAVVGICGASLFLCVLCKLKRKHDLARAGMGVAEHKFAKETNSLLYMPPLSDYESARTGSTLPSNVCRHFTFAEIEDATRCFDDRLIIGVGGFGRVYMGVVRAAESLASLSEASPPGTGLEVAIKRANPASQQGLREFRNEIEMLSKLRHKHLVSLIGYCDESTEMVLVYDYMSNGTLREHLYNKTRKPTLAWRQRLQVCIGAARGLHYLHTGARHTIIHRDVKTTNILLNEAWEAKVADFGLSKAGPDMEHDSHVSTEVKGSFGYLDPEYYRRRKLTEKSDVYSFGVVLFEVLCGRPAVNQNLPKEQANLADWARLCYRKGVLEHIVDPVIKGKIAPKCFVTFAELAERCTADRGVDRPAMQDVLWSLEFALQQQEYAQAHGSLEGEEGDGEEESRYSPLFSTPRTAVTQDTSTSPTNSASSTSSVSWARNDSVPFTPSAIFSEMGDPKGR